MFSLSFSLATAAPTTERRAAEQHQQQEAGIQRRETLAPRSLECCWTFATLPSLLSRVHRISPSLSLSRRKLV